MSIDEVQRAIQAYNRRKINIAKDKAALNHTLGNLIGISVSRIYNKSAKYPELCEVYPELFKNEFEAHEQNKLKTSAERFKAFALQHNKKYS